MNSKFLLFIFSVALFTSCSTYKAGQTPDDVYYSPAKEYVAKQETEVRRDRYEEYVSAEDDRYLRMKIRNRERWSEIDDYSYWNDSRFHDCNTIYTNNRLSGYNRYYNEYLNNGTIGNTYVYNNCVNNNIIRSNYFGYGGFYSPRYPIVYYKSPRVYTGTTGKANLSTYRNPNYDNSNYNQSKSSSPYNFGNLMKRVFSESSNSGTTQTSGSTWERPVRTYESGTTTNSNAGGKSGGYNSTGTSTSTKRDPKN
jgi:hypothetical protein